MPSRQPLSPPPTHPPTHPTCLNNTTPLTTRLASASIDKLAGRYRGASNGESEKQISEEEKEIRESMKPVCHATKDKLKALKSKLSDNSLDHSEKRMRQQTFRSVAQSFVDAVKQYQESQANYENTIREQLGRRLKIVNPAFTDEQVENVIDAGRAQQVFEQTIKSGQGEIANTYRDVMSQHEDIQALEKSIRELMDLFMDMSLLIEQQGDKLDSVEEQVKNANDYVESGTKAIARANKSQKKKRKYMCCCIIVALAALVAVLIPVLTNALATTA